MKEHKIQEYFVKWLQAEQKAGNLICFRIANEQKTGNLQVILKDKRMGNLKGFPDLGVILKNGRVFFIEFKGIKGRLSVEQIDLHATLTTFNTPIIVVNQINRDNFNNIINMVVSLGGQTTLHLEYLKNDI